MTSRLLLTSFLFVGFSIVAAAACAAPQEDDADDNGSAATGASVTTKTVCARMTKDGLRETIERDSDGTCRDMKIDTYKGVGKPTPRSCSTVDQACRALLCSKHEGTTATMVVKEGSGCRLQVINTATGRTTSDREIACSDADESVYSGCGALVASCTASPDGGFGEGGAGKTCP